MTSTCRCVHAVAAGAASASACGTSMPEQLLPYGAHITTVGKAPTSQSVLHPHDGTHNHKKIDPSGGAKILSGGGGRGKVGDTKIL